MRSFPFVFAGALGIHYAVAIDRPTSTMRFTTHNEDVTLDGLIYPATPGFDVTSIQYTADGSPSNCDIQIVAATGGDVEPGEATRGVLDGLPIRVFIFDIGNTTAGGYEMLPGALVGSVVEDSNFIVRLAAQGPLSLAVQPLAEQYSLTCKAALGDDRCKVPLVVPDIGRGQQYFASPKIKIPSLVYGRHKSGSTNASYNDVYYECTTSGTTHASVVPTFPTTPGLTVTDGTVVWTCRRAFVMAVEGVALSFFEIQLSALPAWFESTPQLTPTVLGRLIPRSGPLTGVKIPIRAWDTGTKIVTLFEPFATSNFPAATEFDIHRGCDLLRDTCSTIFSNTDNMRATPDVPASDLILGG